MKHFKSNKIQSLTQFNKGITFFIKIKNESFIFCLSIIRQFYVNLHPQFKTIKKYKKISHHYD
jgi:hypothetical protein